MKFYHIISSASPLRAFLSFCGLSKIIPSKLLMAAHKLLGIALLPLILAFSTHPAFAADVTLAWDPNSEPDLEGYGVYLSQEVPGPPYQLFGYLATNEFDNPESPTFTVTGIETDTRYYFAVTAYNTSGDESRFSNSVCAQVGETVTPCVRANTGGGGTGSAEADGGSGGSGGGCFIESAVPHHARFHPGMDALTAFGCLVALVWIFKKTLMSSFNFSSMQLQRKEDS